VTDNCALKTDFARGSNSDFHEFVLVWIEILNLGSDERRRESRLC
jgi:hypothetical protein